MIKIYGMPTCPDCQMVESQIEGHEDKYQYIDIGSHVKLLKEFLAIRDKEACFDSMKSSGKAGIPCFVLEDGRVTLDPVEAGLKVIETGVACSLEDHKLGKKGC